MNHSIAAAFPIPSRGTFAVLRSVLAAGLLISASAIAQASDESEPDEVPPETIDAVVSCAICHGPNGEGKSALGAPRIGGMAQWYLERQLMNFRNGVRGSEDDDVPGIQMRAMALALDSEAEIEAMSHYFSTLSPPPAPATIEGDAERGEQLYAVCAACHGKDAEGNKALNAPSLKGQHDWYLVRQLENYETGLRGANSQDQFGAQMVPIIKSLDGRQDYVDIAAYINTL